LHQGPWDFRHIVLVLADRLTILQSMKPVVLLACLITLGFGGCSWIPRAGPSASEVVEQSRPDGEILFDVVEVDDHVVATLRAQPKESLAARFTQDTQPPLFNIATGDTISVLIWESAAGGLFTEAPPALSPSGGRTGIEPLAPESPRQEPGAPAPPEQQRQSGGVAGAMLLSEAAGRQAVQFPISWSKATERSASPMPGEFQLRADYRRRSSRRSRLGSPDGRSSRRRW
jgi:hypothetical protein